MCQIDESTNAHPTVAPNDKFQILAEFDHPLLPAWQAFLAKNDVKIAGIEFIADASGRSFTYDVNTNTNYNSDAEAKDGRNGMRTIAEYLGKLLSAQYGAVSGVATAA